MTIQFDENGLVIQTLAEIKKELKNGYTYDGEAKKGYKQFYGAGIQLEDDTNPGKELTIYANREQVLQEVIQAIFFSQYRASASGTSLDRVLEAIELQRKSAQPSAVVVYAAGTPSTVVAAEELRMSVDGTGEIFYNLAGFTLGSIADESVITLTRAGTQVNVILSGAPPFAVDSWVFITGAEQPEYNGLHQITAVFPTAFAYELTGALPISPATGTITAKEATPFNARSELTGPIQALSGAITTIATAVPGIDQVENPNDATLGQNIETDPETRLRASQSLAVAGGSTATAIKSKVLDIDSVTFVTVFQNVTDFVDANGLPPHTIRVIVDGGLDADIWDILYESAVSAGIRMDGTESTTIIDDNGDPQPVAFSRPTAVRIYVDAENGLVTNSDIAQGAIYPVDGDDQVKANLAAIVFELGGDVWPAKIKEAINKVDGVISSDPEFDITPAPTNKTTIAIPAGSRANIDSSDVTI